MSLRIQKRWTQIGQPQKPGYHSAPGIGNIVNITQEHIATAESLGGNPVVLLGHSESSSMVPHWEILEIKQT